MAFDRDVTIDFNADISGYSASMGQMIQQTSQYTAAADGMIGKIGKLNDVVMAGVKHMTALTSTNKVATAQAAAYQQQLSKIETSAKVTGKNFNELEKTTKGLAKDFPIGMKQAVQQVEALQEAGVTSNKEIKQLATTFTKLGAATGTFGPEMGQNMLQLNRTFENGTGSMEKYADSLTQITHQYGANAGAVTSFAKSIAPVAATVGMNETSVLGLSTAFSKLGEDGYSAANTFNKVMLDMSKSIREGTPEAKIYAEVMGTTADQLKDTWSTNPAEGFISFVESIKKQGAGGIRSLEQLGLEGVRTQKTIMALANSGDMRQIVETAQSSYGGGQTAEAAETAMGGVNDQMTMLNETMAQTTATAGKPFLGFLEKVLQVANALSSAISNLVESGPIQGLAKVVGLVGAAWGAKNLFTGTALMGAMGKSLFTGAGRSNFAQEFREGSAAGVGAETEGRGLGYRAGAGWGMYGGAQSGEPGGAVGATQRGWRGARGLVNAGGNLRAAYVRSSASTILASIDEDRLATPAGQALRQSIKDVSAPTEGGFFKSRKIMQERMAEVGKNFGTLATESGGLGNLLQAEKQNIAAAGKFWGRAGAAGARGLGQVGSMATMGLVSGTAAAPVVGAAALVGGAGYAFYKGKKKEDEAIETGGKDAYRMFNDFAEKAGIATKGLVSFSQAITESTAKIAAIKPGEGKTAYDLTEQEKIQAKQPGYERAYSTRGDSFWDKVMPSDFNTEKEALRVRGMLGANASDEAVNRVQMDLVNQLGEEKANAVMTQASGMSKMSSEEIQDALKDAGNKSKTLGIFGSNESAEYKEMAEAELVRRKKAEESIYGEEATTVKGRATAEKGLGAAYGATTAEGRAEAVDDAVTGLNLSSGDSDKLKQAMEQNVEAARTDKSRVMSLPEIMRAAGLDDEATSYEQGLVGTGIAGGKAQYSDVTKEEINRSAVSQGETDAAKSISTLGDLGMTTGTLATDMAGTAKTIRASGKSLEEWTKAVDAGTETATDMEKAWADVQMSPGDTNAQTKLANLAAEKALADADKAGTGSQGARQVLLAAMTSETGAEQPAVQQALTIIQQKQGLTDFSRGKLRVQQDTINAGVTASNTLEGPNSASLTSTQRTDLNTQVSSGLAAQTQKQEMIRQAYIQMERGQEDFQRQMSRMNQQYETGAARQAEDYAKQRLYSIQDYHTSVKNAEEDFHKQRGRAQRDFDKQVKRQSEQTAKNMFDPYVRMAHTTVTSMGVLQQSLAEQNKAVGDQLKNVDKLSSMGLSKDAIDQLKLMDPTQGPQVQRMLADAMTDPKGIDKINSLVKKRLKLGMALNTSEFNKDFQNMTEDFGTSMDDMSKDFDTNMERGEKSFRRGLKRNGEAFATAQSRAAQDHQTALTQMSEDNATAHTRMIEDLTGIGSDYQKSYAEIEKDFLQDLANLPSNLSKATKTAITKVLQDEIDAINDSNKSAAQKAVDAHQAERSDPNNGGDSQEPEGEQGASVKAGRGPTGGVRIKAQVPWRTYSGGSFHGGADIGHRGGGAYAVANGKVVYSGVAPGGNKQNPSGSYGRHVIITDGERDYLYGHLSERQVSAGQKIKAGDRLGTIGNTGNTRPLGSGYHLHFEVRPAGKGHNSAIDPNPWLASGGIVTRHMQPHVGEGGPEAVIPLNEKGMKYLADAINKSVMGRYWNPAHAANSRAAAHSAPVTNNVYSYDQRTQFTGEVHVQSQDPEDMARKLAARERRNRLARKTGSAA